MSKSYNPIILTWANNSILVPEWGEAILMCAILLIYGYIAWRIAKA